MEEGRQLITGAPTAPTGYGAKGPMETDCAAIVPPAHRTSHVLPSSGAVQTNQRPAIRSCDRRGAQAGSILEDRPPVEISQTVYPQFCRVQTRHATFQNWPLNQHFRPEDLVQQGFYYAGYADCIRCFYCGVGLKSWNINDDVMVEHIRWRPSCGYLLNTKGRQFVDGICSRLQTEGNGGSRTDAATVGGGAVDIIGGLGDEVVRQIEEMGFTRSSMDNAVQHLQQSGVTARDLDTVLEAIIELQSRDSTTASNSNDNSQQAAHVAQDSIQTDNPGPEDLGGGAAEEAERIRGENHRLRAVRTCRVCQTATVGMIFMPCGHLVTCAPCGTHVRQCLACGQNIRATANVYLT